MKFRVDMLKNSFYPNYAYKLHAYKKQLVYWHGWLILKSYCNESRHIYGIKKSLSILEIFSVEVACKGHGSPYTFFLLKFPEKCDLRPYIYDIRIKLLKIGPLLPSIRNFSPISHFKSPCVRNLSEFF